MDTKRRLPIVKASSDSSDGRPLWHWIGFGTVAISATWLPLSYAAGAWQRHLFFRLIGESQTPEQVQRALEMLSAHDKLLFWLTSYAAPFVALTGGGFAGGFLIGRWGQPAGRREAVLAGVVAALFATSLTWVMLGVSISSLWILAVAPVAAGLGERFGRKTEARRPYSH